MLLVLVTWVFRRRYYVSYWLVRRSRRLHTKEKEEAREFQYDAFVSYSPGDAAWVEEHLLPEMEEREPRLRVCIHQRDFQVRLPTPSATKVGVTVVENIVEAVNSSRRFLMVVSDSFLQNQWCQFETHVAATQMVETDRWEQGCRERPRQGSLEGTMSSTCPGTV